ncbi:CST complex subunit STN1 [Solanum stenotomum]|uniref:CST complex subunit STN1 n=1 Tax=Solanum stenotomum TaxID=172797 RepID=UPI0020D10291|nr:CST complex subunit STN1 [Solanum stenotomum]
MDALQLVNTHVKLLAFDFLTLKPIPHESTIFFRKGRRLSRAETVGMVVSRDFKPNRFIKFDIDDGTGCIPCILWLNHESSHRRCPSNVRLIAQMAADFASQIQLGVIGRVRGKISRYRGNLQITVSDVVIERDPNSQILHWLDCLRLARNCYDKVVVLPSTSHV